MTDITDEQRAAVEWARSVQKNTPFPDVRTYATSILDLLPSELTNPQPALPTEPGLYAYEGGSLALAFLRTSTSWYAITRSGETTPCVESYITQAGVPLVPLVPERPQITREQVAAVYDAHRHPSDEAVDALLALVNGADRD